MYKFNKASLLAVAAGAVLLSSCSKETDFYDPDYASKQYAKSWESAFGSISAEQDWNMAVRTSLNINLPYLKGESEVKVFTVNPLEKGCYLMAETKLNNGTGSIVFDALKSMDQVFVAVENDGMKRVYGYYGIENGSVNIGANTTSMAKNAPKTRAGECNVTKGERALVITGAESLSGDVKYSYSGNLYTYEELVELVKARGDYYWTDPFIRETCVTFDEWGKPTGWDFSNAKLNDYAVPTTEPLDIYITYLNGVEKAAANPYKISWGYENFGPGSFFEEKLKYYLAPKYGTFYSTPEELAVVEQGFSITTEGGEIELPFIYGATQKSNMLGYVYYKDGQDPLAQPHYVLMNDGRPNENIYFEQWKGTPAGGGDGMGLSNWNVAYPELKTIYGHTGDDLVYGTSYKLTFFGENHDMTTGTYEFPAGYHIAFFICPQNYSSKEELNNYNYSLPELNRRIKHYYSIVPGQDTWQEDKTRGCVKAVSWTYNGRRFLGFEDGGSDEDLNDIVFWVEGAYSSDNEEEIKVPSTDPEPEPEAQTWILACEDLGSVGDFDFNDVVFSVSYVAGQDYATVTPLAAGGNLPAIIKYNGTPIAENAEIHHLLNPSIVAGDDGKYPFINTRGSKGVAGTPVRVAVPTDFTMENHGFTITVEGNGDSKTITMGTETGKAPMMLCLPGDWIWPTEWTRIDAAYPSFVDWVKDTNENEWYKSPVSDKIVQ